MKKIIVLVMVSILSFLTSAYAATWNVEIVSDKDAYVLGENAVFEIEVKKNNKWVRDKQIILEATFPDNNSPVTLEYIIMGRYRFSADLTSNLEQQIFNISLFQNNKPKKLLAQATKTITLIAENNNSFRIKEGDYTNKNEITLLIDSSLNYELMVSEDPLFADCVWMPYVSEMPYVLSSGDGPKTIYLKFQNKISQQEQIESNQITLDTMPPRLTIISPLQGNIVTGRTN
ncbi:MAG: hypothetical protein KJ915_13095 [Candidatus Omnitrophica bacterium]|nr:hypothetical protein [Candidatus Omnitrophota bacterium]